MKHTKIIQTLLDASPGRKYLELGVSDSKGSFTQIKANIKIGVGLVSLDSSLINQENNNHSTYYMLSNRLFFEKQKTNKIKFDVIFIRSHEHGQVYQDIINSLTCLSLGGAIVIHNCKPTNNIISLSPNLYAKVDSKIKRKNNYSWTGDVWKAIIKLRSTHKELNVFTLDTDWGCAIVTKGRPESTLPFSLSEKIESMDFEEFDANVETLLNLKDYNYLQEFISKRRLTVEPKIYTENILQDLSNCLTDMYIPDTVNVEVVENGIILPVVREEDSELLKGGVCDSEFNFVAGVNIRRIDRKPHPRSMTSAYVVNNNNFQVSEDEVVWLGWVDSHFGHMLLEGMSRFWYIACTPSYKGKIAFVKYKSLEIYQLYISLLSWLGVSEDRIIIVDKPTKFKKIIVPDQVLFSHEGYKDHALDAYEKIRDYIKPGKYDKLYLTRSEFIKHDVITLNERYFEKFYESLGYKIIAPEKLPLREQISLIAGAKEIACVQGTLSHLILFANRGIKITILIRTSEGPHFSQIILNQLTNINATFIDVSMNFLPVIHYVGAFLLMPTEHWLKYLKDNGIDCEEKLDIRNFMFEYMTAWVRVYKGYASELIKQKTGIDFLKTIQKYLINQI